MPVSQWLPHHPHPQDGKEGGLLQQWPTLSWFAFSFPHLQGSHPALTMQGLAHVPHTQPGHWGAGSAQGTLPASPGSRLPVSQALATHHLHLDLMLHPTPAWPCLGLGPTRLPEETFINPNPTQPPSADPRRGRPPPCSVHQLLHHLAPTHLPTAPGPPPARSAPDFARIHPFCSFRLHTLTQASPTPVSLLHFAFPNLARGHLCHCEITPGPHPPHLLQWVPASSSWTRDSAPSGRGYWMLTVRSWVHSPVAA